VRGHTIGSFISSGLLFEKTTGRRILFTDIDQIHCPISFESHADVPATLLGCGVVKGVTRTHIAEMKKDVGNFGRFMSMAERYPSEWGNLDDIRQGLQSGVCLENLSVPSEFLRVVNFTDDEKVRKFLINNLRIEWLHQSVSYGLGREAPILINPDFAPSGAIG